MGIDFDNVRLKYMHVNSTRDIAAFNPTSISFYDNLFESNEYKSHGNGD